MKLLMKIPALLLVAVITLFSGCKKEEVCTDHKDGHPGPLKTTIVTSGNLQTAFDFMGSKGHESMLKSMKLDDDTVKKSDRYVLITLMDKNDRKLIMNASVKVIIAGPDGTRVESTAKALTGGGMHHYIAGFPATEKGEYKVDAFIDLSGKKVAASTTYIVR